MGLILGEKILIFVLLKISEFSGPPFPFQNLAYATASDPSLFEVKNTFKRIYFGLSFLSGLAKRGVEAPCLRHGVQLTFYVLIFASSFWKNS